MRGLPLLTVVGLAIACHARERNVPAPTIDVRTARPIASNHPSVPESAALPPVQLELKVEPTDDANIRALVLASSDPPLHRLLMRIRSDSVCGIETQGRVLEIRCPEAGLGVFMGDGELRVGGAEDAETFAPRREVRLPTQIDAPTPLPCAIAAATDIVDVHLRRSKQTSDSGTEYALVMDLLGRNVLLTELGSGPMSCSTTLVFPKTTALSGGCAFSEAGVGFSLSFEDSVLWIGSRSSSYEGSHEHARSGIRLPCGSKPRFHELKVRDAKWRRFGSGCSDRCFTDLEGCEERCYRRLADDHGELTASGRDCVTQCSSAKDRCTRACQARGQYP